jgi:hypothetical protein
MTPAELNDLILGLAADHPARVAFDAAEDVACADALRAPQLPGYIPRRDVVVVLANYGQVDGILSWVWRFGTMPPPLGGGDADFGLFCLANTINRIAGNDTGIQLEAAKLVAVRDSDKVQQLIAGGVFPLAFFDDLLAREVKLPLAVALATEVETARKS